MAPPGAAKLPPVAVPAPPPAICAYMGSSTSSGGGEHGVCRPDQVFHQMLVPPLPPPRFGGACPGCLGPIPPPWTTPPPPPPTGARVSHRPPSAPPGPVSLFIVPLRSASSSESDTWGQQCVPPWSRGGGRCRAEPPPPLFLDKADGQRGTSFCKVVLPLYCSLIPASLVSPPLIRDVSVFCQINYSSLLNSEKKIKLK